MKKLIFVTSKFPFGNGETFIENEIKYLSNSFDKVYIYATEANSLDKYRTVPENVSIYASNPKIVTKANYFACLAKSLVIAEIFKNCLRGNIPAKISAACYFYASFLNETKNLNNFLNTCDFKPDDEITIYSYWLSTIGMSALKIKQKLEKRFNISKTVSRCHGFDVYADRTHINYLPFQKYLIKNFDKIYPCSKSGEEYLKNCYPSQKDKIIAKYLGVEDNFNFVFPKREEIFNIVSCSNIIPVKRVHLIAEALSKITDKKILWTHFGDGEEFENLKQLSAKILPKNIKTEFKGRIPNSQIYDYYNNNNVNLFINVSSSEGLPVSIMEATSFGIPVIATDVGGTSEIVFDGNNGFLLKSNFKPQELTDLIYKFCDMDEKEYNVFCKESRDFFVNNFEAKNNYSEFCNQLTSNESGDCYPKG